MLNSCLSTTNSSSSSSSLAIYRVCLSCVCPLNSKNSALVMDVAEAAALAAAKKHAICCRPTLPYLVEKKLIEKQNRHIYIVDKFMPPRKVLPMQDKFYSKYFQYPASHEKYIQHIDEATRKRHDQRSFLPMLESQVYGWFPASVNLDDVACVNYISAPKLRCDMTIFGEQLFAGRITEKPPFNGLRFFLR